MGEPEAAAAPNMNSKSKLLETSWKEGKCLAHFSYVFRWSYFFFKPRRIRTRV